MIFSIYKSKWQEIMPLLHSNESLVSFGNLIQQLPFPTLHLRFVLQRKETLMETHRVLWLYPSGSNRSKLSMRLAKEGLGDNTNRVNDDLRRKNKKYQKVR